MNVYDFDKTIFYPDSSACFFRFCLRHYPAAVLASLPRSAVLALGYAAGRIPTQTLKQQLFSFLRRLPDVDRAVAEFWAENEKRLGDWYLRQRRDDDLIVSASPEFLLAPICEKLNVRLLATRMDRHSGRIDGENCHDEEKVRRFYAVYPGEKPEAFYSDSLSDSPMAAISETAFLVKKHRLAPWPIQ